MAESQNTEWKESWRDDYLKWVCGFANAQGGRIYIGVDDNGTAVGVKNWKDLLDNLPNKIQNTMGIMSDVNHIIMDEKDCVEIAVRPSAYPVNYKGAYYYRSGSTTQQLVGVALNEFLISKTGLRWEDVTVPGVTVDDLDKESFDIFRREALRSERMTKSDLQISNAKLLEKLELVTERGLKRAAIMLFHREPEKWVPGCYTKIGKFVGSDLRYQDEVHGSLFIQADRVVELIYLKYLIAPVTYENLTRVETYPYAKDAVREGVYNALIHSCWSRGIPIQIRINVDTMFISNECEFPTDWTPETLMHSHKSRAYNPCIAKAFFRAGYVEAWGRGIEKICDECEAYGADKPEYIVHSVDIMLILHALKDNGQVGNADQIDQTTDRTGQKLDQLDQNTTQATTQAHKNTTQARKNTTQTTTQAHQNTTQADENTIQTTTKNESIEERGDFGDKLVNFTDTERDFLHALYDYPGYSQRELAIVLGWGQNKVKYYAKKLKKANVICHIGSSQKGYWKIQL